jgi:transposase
MPGDNSPLKDNPGAFLRLGYILALHDEGYVNREIGKRIGRSNHRVSQLLHRAKTLRRATPSMRGTTNAPD